MNILKHMEAVFIAVALIAVPASYFGAVKADGSAAPVASAASRDPAIATSGKVAVVTITAKRLDRNHLLAAR